MAPSGSVESQVAWISANDNFPLQQSCRKCPSPMSICVVADLAQRCQQVSLC